ncbi:MAG: hypothetical protein CMJ31_13355 [Phycisphaerae bacterium]|nr:hypothetical protein [Phycisphaerae bacterium]
MRNDLCSIAAGAAIVMTAGLATAGDTTYQYDDGTSNILLGPPRSFAEFGDIDMLWGNYFFTETATEIVQSITFGVGGLSTDTTVSLWLFADADGDADPTNATPLFSTTVDAAGLGSDLMTVAIDPTEVSGGFFVAVGHLAELTGGTTDPDYPAPARFDPDARADRSWFFYDNDIPEDDLGSSGFVQRMDGEFVPIPGAFSIRATTTPVPAPSVATALGLGGLLAARRRRA